MATKKVKLSGIGYWAKVFAENRDLTGFENALKEVGGQTTIDVDLDTENYALLKKSGSMKKGRPSPDNPELTRVKFTRKWEQQFGGGAPIVHKEDGTNWDYDTDGFIGNGSEVTIILSVYNTSRSSIIGTRLDKVKVTKAVAYDPDADKEDTPTPAPAAKKTPAPVTDDEIPF